MISQGRTGGPATGVHGSLMNGNREADWEIQVFFDGDCLVCRREMAFLRRLHRGRRIRYTDIAAADFDPAHWGKSRSEFMDRIHARLHERQP